MLKWLLTFFSAILIMWAIYSRNQNLNLRPDQSESKLDVQNRPPQLKEISSSVFLKKNPAPLSAPEKIAKINIPEVLKVSDTEGQVREAKKDIQFLNEHVTSDIESLANKSKAWSALPPIASKENIAILMCGGADLKFKKDTKNRSWHITIQANYVDDQNFGSAGVLQDGILMSYHTSDEVGAFLADPNDLTHFIIRPSKMIYLQLFSMGNRRADRFHYVYAGNVYIQNEKTKIYERVAVALFDNCGSPEDGRVFSAGRGLEPFDNLSLIDTPIRNK